MPYQQIYAANAILEGLSRPNGVSPSVKLQLQGEALFIRAFTYFYLVNLYGEVPLQLTSDYRIMKIASRASVLEIYQQIIADLKIAEASLTDSYVTSGRVRPNLSAAQSLLARTYLYMKDWENAEKYASLIIAKTHTYRLVGLDSVFLKDSPEAIWQLMPKTNSNTNEGALFILVGKPSNVSLNSDFALNGFEPDDKRKDSWTQSFTNSTGTYYYPGKYKIRSSTTVSEYSMVFRLAEQYLIRAEARAHLGNLNGALLDDDVIRKRAGLPDLAEDLSQMQILDAIQNERFNELFSEWGHRWFDLKRTGKANDVLSPAKAKWQPTDILYPIPQTEINRNNNITQNHGY